MKLRHGKQIRLLIYPIHLIFLRAGKNCTKLNFLREIKFFLKKKKETNKINYITTFQNYR